MNTYETSLLMSFRSKTNKQTKMNLNDLTALFPHLYDKENNATNINRS